MCKETEGTMHFKKHIPEDQVPLFMKLTSQITAECIHDLVCDFINHCERIFPEVPLPGVIDPRPAKVKATNRVRIQFAESSGESAEQEGVGASTSIEMKL